MILTKPPDPAAHGLKRRVIGRVLIGSGNDPVYHTWDDFCSIMLVRYKAVRQFIMVAPAITAFKPSDHKCITNTAFSFPDPCSWITVCKDAFPASGTDMISLTALNKKLRFPPCRLACNLIWWSWFFIGSRSTRLAKRVLRDLFLSADFKWQYTDQSGDTQPDHQSAILRELQQFFSVNRKHKLIHKISQ